MDEISFDIDAAKKYVLDKFREQGDFSIFKEQLLDKMVNTVLLCDRKYAESIPDDGYYDDDEAFDHLLEEMQRSFPDQKMYMMRFVEDYMEYNEEYLDRNGLIDWD